MYLVQRHPTLRGCMNFQKGELKRGGRNMHFDASEEYLLMKMDLIGAANDYCSVF